MTNERQPIVAAAIAVLMMSTPSPVSAGAATSPPSTAPATAPFQRPASKNAAGEVVLTFTDAPIGKPLPTWTQGDVTFTLASPPRHSHARGRVMFFPHLKTDRRGLVNAMATEQAIAVRADIVGGATSVSLVLWGTIGSHAWLEAHDNNGKLLDRASLPATVPERKSPSDPIPSFELTVKGGEIGYILFGGADNGGALVADEMRYEPAK
jgi:hypothetical protein